MFVEERRRLKIIPNGFGEKPVLKLMFGALIRAAERWRGLRFTEFELRQLAAVRKELDEEYQAAITPQREVIPTQLFQQIRALTASAPWSAIARACSRRPPPNYLISSDDVRVPDFPQRPLGFFTSRAAFCQQPSNCPFNMPNVSMPCAL